MKRAILYARVSTDEQALHGFGREDQVNRIRAFCKQHDIEIVEEHLEDYSAKTFDRPEITKILHKIVKKAIKVDYIIVTKVDRFSRNSAETRRVVELLRKFDVKVLTIEGGELNYTSSAKYFNSAISDLLAEHDNIVRSEFTKRGMRQAMKNGYYVSSPPQGYVRDKETKILMPDKPISDVVAWCFNQYGKGIYSAEEVRRDAIQKGLRLQKQGFINMLQNPVFMGKILIKKSEEEQEQLVNGLHEPIVSEELFYAVQDILKGKRKPYKQPKSAVNEILPLRGHLICPNCQRTLTGSINQNRPGGNRIAYYHCQTNKYACNHRVNANNAHKVLQEYLQTFQPSEEVIELFTHVLSDLFNTKDGDRQQRKKQIEDAIEEINGRIENIDYKYADGTITDDNYNRIISKLKNDHNELIMQHATFTKVSPDLRKYASYSTGLLQNLTGYYAAATASTKHKLLGVIFPEKLAFKENWYYTTKANEVFSLICSLDKGLHEKSPAKIARLYSKAPPVGLEPTTL